jgi:5-methylcytosine-specific restriction endonuclease McrA
MKICSKCKIAKDISQFGKDVGSKDGLYSSCLLCEKIRNKGRSHVVSRRFADYKARAKKKGISFKISLKQFIEMTSKPCGYCGGFSDEIENFCGIDRINSNKGYIKDNIMPCCDVCNRMKGTLNFQRFLDKIESIFHNIFELGVNKK